MSTPIPSPGHQLERFEYLDQVVLAGSIESETTEALRKIIVERHRQVVAGHDAQHDAEHGELHLVSEAFDRVNGLTVSRQQIIEAAALLLAAVEVSAYNGWDF